MSNTRGGFRNRPHLKPDNPVVMLVATLIIAIGVIGVALVSSTISGRKPVANLDQVPGMDLGAAPAPATSTVSLLLLNKDSATILHLDGKEERVSMSELEKRFGTAPRPSEGSNAANGGFAAYPMPGLTPGAVPSPDGAYSAHLADPRADGATAVLLKPAQGAERTVVLRKGNEPLRDGAFAGWFDARTMGIVAYTDAEKSLYAAGLDGSLRKLVTLPDDVALSSMRDGAFWYITATQGAGIEVAPQGPSELHRVSVDGKDVRMTREEKHVIFGLIADGKGRVVYSLDDGSAVLIGLDLPQGRMELGQRRPVGMLPDGRLVLREGYGLATFDPLTGDDKALGDLPEGDVQVFVTDVTLAP